LWIAASLREPRASAIGIRHSTGIGGVAFGNDTSHTLVHVASDRLTLRDRRS